ncbi:MAG TPA: hypothetical protein VJJ75_02120 [Candidatus Nanoarchaeia archaeon]|nr:hypothetical protein [Candidatus Nanoarchaeia archaeon]
MKPRPVYYGCLLFLGFFVFIIAYSIKLGDGYYIVDSIKFILLMIIFYWQYERLNFSPWIFFGLGVVMTLHDFGRFGAFNWTLGIFSWDMLTHFAASFIIAIALFAALSKIEMPAFWKGAMIFFIALGIATLGEFAEFGGAIKTPDGKGILGVESLGSPIPWLSPDYWDTMKDLVLNAAGSLIGIAAWLLRKRHS